MIKKFFTIIILTLSWCNISSANIIDLYCKFITGKIEGEGKTEVAEITSYTIGERYQKYIRGIKIKIDTSKKKIIEAPEYSSEKGWKSIFGEDEIWWYWDVPDTGVLTHFILNRYTGQLREEFRLLTGDPKDDTRSVTIYNCSKAQRLF